MIINYLFKIKKYEDISHILYGYHGTLPVTDTDE